MFIFSIIKREKQQLELIFLFGFEIYSSIKRDVASDLVLE